MVAGKGHTGAVVLQRAPVQDTAHAVATDATQMSAGRTAAARAQVVAQGGGGQVHRGAAGNEQGAGCIAAGCAFVSTKLYAAAAAAANAAGAQTARCASHPSGVIRKSALTSFIGASLTIGIGITKGKDIAAITTQAVAASCAVRGRRIASPGSPFAIEAAAPAAAAAITAPRRRHVACQRGVQDGDRAAPDAQASAQRIPARGLIGRISLPSPGTTDQPPGDGQPVQQHRAPGDFEHAAVVVGVQRHIGHAVVVHIAIKRDALADGQLRKQADRHAVAEGDGVAALRRGQGSAQRTRATVVAVGDSQGLQRPRVVKAPGRQRRGRCPRQQTSAFNGTGLHLQSPVAPRAGAVAAGRHVRARERGQGGDKLRALLARRQVAGIDQQVTALGQAPAQGGQRGAVAGQRARIQEGAAQPHLAGAAVRQDVHARHIAALAQGCSHLLQAVCAGAQVHHFGVWGKTLQQSGSVLHAAVNKNDFAQGGGCGEVHGGFFYRGRMANGERRTANGE